MLDRTNAGGNNSARAELTAATNNRSAYLAQEFSSRQTQAMSAQWHIYVDSITNHADNPDGAARMLIRDDTWTNSSRSGPNAVEGERFVYMAFHKDDGGTTGTTSLVARAPVVCWTLSVTAAGSRTLQTRRAVVGMDGFAA